MNLQNLESVDNPVEGSKSKSEFYEHIKRELLIALRGKLSQAELSRELGFDFNQYFRWESNTKKLLWNEFVNILDCLSKTEQLKKSFKKKMTMEMESLESKDVLSKLIRGRELSEVAEFLATSEPTLRRWLKGEGSPRIEDVFKIIYEWNNTLDLLLLDLVPLEKLPTLTPIHKDLLEVRSLFSHHPEATNIYAYTGNDQYLMAPGDGLSFLAEKTGIETDKIKKNLYMMELTGLLCFDPKIGKLRHPDNDQESTNKIKLNDSLETFLSLASYWNTMSHKNIENLKLRGPLPDRYDYLCTHSVPVSENTAHKIRLKLENCYKEIMEIVSQDTPPRIHTKTLFMHFFEHEDCR